MTVTITFGNVYCSRPDSLLDVLVCICYCFIQTWVVQRASVAECCGASQTWVIYSFVFNPVVINYSSSVLVVAIVLV